MIKMLRWSLCIITWTIGIIWYYKIPGFNSNHIFIVIITWIIAFAVLVVPIKNSVLSEESE